MVQVIIDSVEQVNELPAVKKVCSSPFVRSKIEQFDKFLGKLVSKNVEKAIEPSKKKLTILHWVLINLVVLAYFSGLAEAKNISDFQIIFDNYKLMGLSFLIINTATFIFMKMSVIIEKIIGFVIQIFTLLLVLFFIYWIVVKAINWYRNLNKS